MCVQEPLVKVGEVQGIHTAGHFQVRHRFLNCPGYFCSTGFPLLPLPQEAILIFSSSVSTTWHVRLNGACDR